MWQDCDESHRIAVDRLLIRPTHGRQAGAGDNKRTNHSQGIPKQEPVTRRVTPAATSHQSADQPPPTGVTDPHSHQKNLPGHPALLERCGALKHLSPVQDEAEGNARGGEVLTGVLRDPSQRDSYVARQARAQSGSLLALL